MGELRCRTCGCLIQGAGTTVCPNCDRNPFSPPPCDIKNCGNDKDVKKFEGVYLCDLHRRIAQLARHMAWQTTPRRRARR